MKNKKRVLGITAIALVSSALLVVNAFAAANNVSGYEALKQSAFKMAALENATITATFSMSENGTVLAEGEMVHKMESFSRDSSNESFTLNGKTCTMESYSADGVGYVRPIDSEEFFSYRHEPAQGNAMEGITDNQKKLAELLLDTFVGSAKNYFTNDDGHITVTLEGNQIPEVAQLMGAVIVEAADPTAHGRGGNHEDSFGDLVKIRKDLVIQSASLSADLDEQGRMSDLDTTFTISGNETGGTLHTYTIALDASFTDYGTTKADLINPNAKVQDYEEYADDKDDETIWAD